MSEVEVEEEGNLSDTDSSAQEAEQTVENTEDTRNKEAEYIEE
jgi:hypothetical protein